MKNTCYTLFGILVVSALALNTASAGPVVSTTPVDCYLEAQKKLRIPSTSNGLQALATLCRGATSSASVTCYEQAVKEFPLAPLFWEGIGLMAQLCSGATSNAPLICAQKAIKQININVDVKADRESWEGFRALATLCGNR
jgi:hypothetical protein